MKHMTKITFSALCVSVLLASACAELSEPVYTVDGKEVSATYATKVLNSEEEADRSTLLIFLNGGAADLLSQGVNNEALSEACEQAGVKSIERLFVSNTEQARAKGMHRWYLLTFEQEMNPYEINISNC